MDADVRDFLEQYWDGLISYDDLYLHLSAIAETEGMTYEQLAEKYGFNPKNP